jgi:hypothetical protein
MYIGSTSHQYTAAFAGFRPVTKRLSHLYKPGGPLILTLLSLQARNNGGKTRTTTLAQAVGDQPTIHAHGPKTTIGLVPKTHKRHDTETHRDPLPTPYRPCATQRIPLPRREAQDTILRESAMPPTELSGNRPTLSARISRVQHGTTPTPP